MRTRCLPPFLAAWLGLCLALLPSCAGPPPAAERVEAARVIVFVWDGLRPDSIGAGDTPNLLRVSQAGVRFSNHHSTYPTFTMINAASLATGGFPGTTGFYGNTVYQPGAEGRDAQGRPVDFGQPVFAEDYGVLRSLDAFQRGRLLQVETLFQVAQRAGLTTVSLGKSGPAFLQDRQTLGSVLDERAAFPLALVRELQASGVPLPRLTPLAHPAGAVTLAPGNGDPTAHAPKVTFADGVTPDPSDRSGSPNNAANQYLLGVYLDALLPRKAPQLSVVWLRTPDTAQHAFGPGSANARDGLRAQDALLGQLLAKLELLGLADSTDLLIVSDHGHSSVSGDPALFPLRGVRVGAPGALDPAGFSVSGEVRLADLLTRAGFPAYDGLPCAFSPVLSGIRADGTPVLAPKTEVRDGPCGARGTKYTTGSFPVPKPLPPGALVVAANGGSDYLYLPDHDAATVRRAVRFLQSREEIGPIFVAKRYGSLPGTLPLEAVRLENPEGRNPDVILSFSWDDTVAIAGMPGIEYQSVANYRGMHGSFSPIDVHNVLIAWGPHFARGLVDPLPSGNVDVAPTVAHLLGLPLPAADGRVLLEALSGSGVAASDYRVTRRTLSAPEPATGLAMQRPTRPDGGDVDAGRSSYTAELSIQVLEGQGESRTYFDQARALRR